MGKTERRTEPATAGRGLFRSMVQPAVVIGSTLLLMDAGCGGRVDPSGAFFRADGGPDDFPPLGDGGSFSQGGSKAAGGRTGRSGGAAVGGGFSSGGRRPPPPPPTSCGNGIVEPGEECDGPPRETCSAITMGAFPFGPLLCTPDCRRDTSLCTSQGVGGGIGTGGRTGTGGMPSWQQECFDGEGVPLSGVQGCVYGDEAVKSCMVDYWGQASGGCAVACGCPSCPGTMAECATDLACTWILGCAVQSGCGTLASCYADYPSCTDLIDRSGGRQSTGSLLARSALTCLSNAGCPTGCL